MTKHSGALLVAAALAIGGTSARAARHAPASAAASLEAAVRAQLGGIKSCLERTVAEDGTPQKVTVELRVTARDGHGVVASGGIGAGGDSGMKGYLCVVEAFADTTLPAPPDGQAVTFRYPIQLY